MNHSGRIDSALNPNSSKSPSSIRSNRARISIGDNFVSSSTKVYGFSSLTVPCLVLQCELHLSHDTFSHTHALHDVVRPHHVRCQLVKCLRVQTQSCRQLTVHDRKSYNSFAKIVRRTKKMFITGRASSTKPKWPSPSLRRRP